MRDIAKVLGRSPNTISYELKHNSVMTEGTHESSYDPLKAKQKARVSRRSRRYQWQKIEQRPALRAFVIEKLETHDWSPDAIAGYLSSQQSALPTVGKDQIYAWLYSSRGQVYCRHLLSQRYASKKRKTNKTERVMIPDRVSITERPVAVEDRQESGHWEYDSVVSSKRSGSTSALAVAVERTTRLVTATLVPNLRPAGFAAVIAAQLAHKHVASLTTDNGIENKQHCLVTGALPGNPIVFFTDPYSSWQKGGVENGNKMLRRYFPKGTDFSTVTQLMVDRAVALINQKPRRCLGFKSALQLAEEKGII